MELFLQTLVTRQYLVALFVLEVSEELGNFQLFLSWKEKENVKEKILKFSIAPLIVYSKFCRVLMFYWLITKITENSLCKFTFWSHNIDLNSTSIILPFSITQHEQLLLYEYKLNSKWWNLCERGQIITSYKLCEKQDRYLFYCKIFYEIILMNEYLQITLTEHSTFASPALLVNSALYLPLSSMLQGWMVTE